jgi:FkbM family methyltransferase
VFSSFKKLRPTKIRSALRRRWFEYQLPRIEMREIPGLVKLGTAYGGWTIPGDLVEPSWLCYCVGAGGDIGFDLELINRYGTTVRAFDAVADYVEQAEAEAGDQPSFSVRQVAIAASDGPLRMQITHDRSSHSVSSAGLYDSREFIELPGRTLPSLAAELGDERIDLLKLDIEGGEYGVLPTLDLQALGVKVFATQLHHNGSIAQARAIIAQLRDAGYEPVACRPVVKLTFVRSDLLPS